MTGNADFAEQQPIERLVAAVKQEVAKENFEGIHRAMDAILGKEIKTQEDNAWSIQLETAEAMERIEEIYRILSTKRVSELPAFSAKVKGWVAKDNPPKVGFKTASGEREGTIYGHMYSEVARYVTDNDTSLSL